MKQEDEKRAREISRGLIESGTTFPVEVSLGVAFDIEVLVDMVTHEMRVDGLDFTAQEILLRKLKEVVPVDLTVFGPDAYKGDIEEKVRIDLSFGEVGIIGGSTLNLLSGDIAVLDPELQADPAFYDSMKLQHLKSYLAVEQSFVNAGGKRDYALLARVANEMT